jgi:hypothetical protein
MKKFLFIISLVAVSSTFANTVSVYRFDDVDAVAVQGEIVSVEDLRDGFASVKGVQVSEETISITNESKALILLRNSVTNKFFRLITTMGAKIGGDGGGG